MLKHLTTHQIERYRQQVMSPAELLAVDDHVAACSQCRQSLADSVQPQNLFASWRADLSGAGNEDVEHLAYEQLEAYVDGGLDEVDCEIVESHLELCSQCVAELRDLRAFRAMMATYPAKDYAPVQPPTLWEKFLAFWRLPAHWIPLQVAGMSAAAFCVWFVMRSSQIPVGEIKLTPPPQADPRVAQLTTQLERTKASLELEQKKAETLRWDEEKTRQTNEALRKQNAGLLAKLQPPPLKIHRPSPSVNNSQKLGDLKKLIGEGGLLMSSSPESNFHLLGPVGTFVASDRPTFSWQPMEGATTYAVTVLDAKGDEIATAPVRPQSPLKDKMQWALPSALKRGAVYSWYVVATLSDGKEVKSPAPDRPDAKFKVLDQKEWAEFTAKQKRAASPLESAKVYLDFGLLDEAERALQTFRRPAAEKSSTPQ